MRSIQLKRSSGPIVRINPYEIHIRDPDYYETIYSQGSGIDKADFATYQFSSPGAAVSTVKAEKHRIRKAALVSFFSKAKVTTQVPNIQARVEKIDERLTQEYLGTGKVLNICDLMSCYTSDVITRYALGISYDFLDSTDFISPFTAANQGFKDLAHYGIQLPWLVRLILAVPDSWVKRLNPKLAPTLDFKNVSHSMGGDSFAVY
jgi:hypothetical protein